MLDLPPQHAHPAIIISRWRFLSRVVSPDKVARPGADQVIRLVNSAKEVLLDSGACAVLVAEYNRGAQQGRGGGRSFFDAAASWVRGVSVVVAGLLQDAKPKYAGWRIVLCGHSQGAGIAALLAFYLRGRLQFSLFEGGISGSMPESTAVHPPPVPEVPVYAICYSCPRVLSRHLSNQCSQGPLVPPAWWSAQDSPTWTPCLPLLSNFIIGTDFIPWADLGSLPPPSEISKYIERAWLTLQQAGVVPTGSAAISLLLQMPYGLSVAAAAAATVGGLAFFMARAAPQLARYSELYSRAAASIEALKDLPLAVSGKVWYSGINLDNRQWLAPMPLTSSQYAAHELRGTDLSVRFWETLLYGLQHHLFTSYVDALRTTLPSAFPAGPARLAALQRLPPEGRALAIEIFGGGSSGAMTLATVWCEGTLPPPNSQSFLPWSRASSRPAFIKRSMGAANDVDVSATLRISTSAEAFFCDGKGAEVANECSQFLSLADFWGAQLAGLGTRCGKCVSGGTSPSSKGFRAAQLGCHGPRDPRTNHYVTDYIRERLSNPSLPVEPGDFETVNARMWDKLQLRDTSSGLYSAIVKNVEGCGQSEYNCAAITVGSSPAELEAFFDSSAFHIIPVIFRLALPSTPVAVLVNEDYAPLSSDGYVMPALPATALAKLQDFVSKLSTPSRPALLWQVCAAQNLNLDKAFVSLINAKLGNAAAAGGGSFGGTGGAAATPPPPGSIGGGGGGA